MITITNMARISNPGISFPNLVYCLILIFSVCPAATAVSSMDALSAQDHQPIEDLNMASLLKSINEERDVLFSEALGLLESMNASPSCNRMAVSKLVASCQSIGGRSVTATTNTFVTLEHVRSLYAARLAICELNEAGAAVPPPCIPITVQLPQKKGIFGISSNYKPRFNAVESVSKGQLETCLKLLESRPQWWTSYSNSRQNAVVICQAARFESEREELLELHRSIVQSSVKLNHGLQEALEVAAAGSSRYKEFVQVVEDMRSRLFYNLEETESHFKVTFERLFCDMEAYVGSVINSVSSAIGSLHGKAELLDKNIDNATHDANHLRHLLKALHDEAIDRNKQMASVQQQDALASKGLALSLQSSLEKLIQGDMNKLSQSVDNFDSSLEWLTAKFVQILQQEQSISERLISLETSLAESRVMAQELHKSQLQHSAAIQGQTQLQEHLQTNMRISQALLDKTTATAANLHAMIDDTATRYKDVPAFRGFLGSYPTGTVYSLLVGLIGSQSPRLAIIMLVVGIYHCTIARII
ncbi:hypothetical protein BO94DRAFT_519292 [Aspergillus sclerotioniger CBS 115572]|uniref:Nuclear membrane fusion protein Kar5 n=1 Tax=Aspergillus sclerotioniger CBS 115572 TaxID=1450535 RepID=A0A317WCV4_9EURO|nr:hypothetical protein BO94DRAFT_519292 [Aspergillus sclerotioniger CBS 115572]PWY83745.1 hypothetical protein BO94DRAFT_519292 [Aspergillus sclerotioniger CBS 115572]